MNKRINRDDLYKATAVELYKMVLKGDLKKFPGGFWQRPDADKNAIEVTKYLFEEILKWSFDDIKEKLTVNIYIEYKLYGMIQQSYNRSSFKAINSVYPDKFKPWEISSVPHNYWTLDKGIISTRWLIEEKLKWTDEDIKEKLSHKVFFENGLGGMLTQLFKSSYYNAINATYPKSFKPWELNSTPRSYWTMQTGISATKWLIEEKLKWNDEDIKKSISVDIFNVNGLKGMLERVYIGSPYNAISSLYPDRFKPWQLNIVPHNYWTAQTGIEAIRWLIEEKYQWSDMDIKKNFCTKVFIENGLVGLLGTLYNGSPFKAINTVYPGKFKPWQLMQAPNKYWTAETGKEAIRWLIEEKYKWCDSDIKNFFCAELLKKNGLMGMLRLLYNGSPFQAINAVYPDKIKPWELVQVPSNYWTIENGIEATKWLIEEILEWTNEDIIEKLSRNVFKENGLSGMLQSCYNSSPSKAINSAYPGRFKVNIKG